MVFSSREIQRGLIQIKVYYKNFYSVSKEASHKPLKVAAAKKYFPSVFIIDTTCFDECFLFYVITGNSIFIQIYHYPEAWVMMLQCSLKQVFRKKSPFYVCYLHNNITMKLIPKVQNKASTS